MKNIDIIISDVIVIGTGAAGYSAACRIKEDGRKSVCMVTEGVLCGTSRNTGSDKQTYYKLGLGGSAPDSVRSMAETLFSGGCVDGDNALCEAALSTRCFYNLCEAGVPFPSNRYGEYIGYKTDHDPYARATSAGPLTSKYMTEVLQRKAKQLEITVYDRLLAVEILTENNKVCGLICFDMDKLKFEVFKCDSIIMATGGPSGIYSDSVYPESHNGFTSLAINAGAELQNMTEWQYGIASVKPRWNVSGTYMQVLPRFVSIDEQGNEYEFLSEYFQNKYEAMSTVFLKGYQWPFDIQKVTKGSSVIDLLVYREKILRNRRVYLDFTKNPFGLESIEYDKLGKEAYEYLNNAQACFGTPIERLKKMNQPAIDLYKSKGLDITEKYLEIALCSQHNNGGIAVDKWWQTSIEGLFATGECAGTHGVARPGGSALNAGQTGALRAATFINESNCESMENKKFYEIAMKSLNNHECFLQSATKGKSNVSEELDIARRKMSACGAAIRDITAMNKLKDEIQYKLDNFGELFGIPTKKDAVKLYRLKDTLTVQLMVLSSMTEYFENTGVSRGSGLYTDEKGELRDGLEELFRFVPDTEGKANGEIQQISFKDGKINITRRLVRPLPEEHECFENIWAGYRENKNIY